MITATLKNRLPNDRVFNLIDPQAGFVRTEARYPAYVGAWGTGKSLAGIGKAMAFSEEFPDNLGIIFRKEFVDLRDSTIKDFEKYTGMKVDSSREVELPNGSQIMFRHIEELNNIQNVNLGWFWIEQAEELDTDEQFFTLFGRLRRKDVRHCGFITANTNGHNWIYKLWKLRGGLDGGELYEAKTEANAHNLPAEFLKSLETLKVKKPKLYNRFVLNSWDESDTIDIIIDPHWIYQAQKRELAIDPPIRKIVSIDVARYGDDKTLFYAIENNKVLGHEEHEKRSTMECVGLAQIFAKKHGIDAFAVDEIGVGAGVADRLRELDKEVVFVNSSKKSHFEEYYNLRAEIYSTGADLFEAGKVQIEADDDDLAEQLAWAKYKTIKSNGVYQVEAKEDIKERYGRSPDNADCFLNGLWALKRINAISKKDAYSRPQFRRPSIDGRRRTWATV